MTIHRVTSFIIPKEEDVDFLLAQYQVLGKVALRVCLITPPAGFAVGGL